MRTDDRILQRTLTNIYNAFIATPESADQGGPSRVLADAPTRIAFRVDPYISHFEIVIAVPEAEDDELHKTSYLRFNSCLLRIQHLQHFKR
jgi:hypothetical protein